MKAKRISAILLTLALCLGSVSMIPMTATAAQVESVDLSAIADGGTYTSNGVTYTVLKSADTIQSKVKANMSGNYILGNDIDFGGKTHTAQIFGTSTFKGIFDGNGYSMINFSSSISGAGNVGLLFHTVDGDTAKVANLTVGSASAPISFQHSINGTECCVGGIAGKNSNGSPTFENITVYANITENGAVESPRIGGIVGKTAGANYTSCSFYGSINYGESATYNEKNARTGGIVGQHDKALALTFTDCHNYATINTSNRTIGASTVVHTYTGGILGASDQTAGATTVTFRNCSNAGALTGNEYVGGIAGGFNIPKTITSTYVFENCSNTGAITADIFAGGILGVALSGGGASESPFTVTLINCANRANVSSTISSDTYLTAKSDDTASAAAGGIVGKALCGDWTLTDCSSIGTISSNSRIGTSSPTAAGIIGNLKVNASATDLSEFTRCYAIGTLNIYNSNYQACAITPINTNSASKGYLPKIVDCYYSLSVNKGSVLGVCNTKLGAGSENMGALTAEEITAGKLTYLLGNTYGQKLGTDNTPVYGSDDLVAFDGENYLNTDASHLLTTEHPVYVQKSNDNTKVRVILIGEEGTEIPADQALTLTFYQADGQTVLKTFTVSGDKLEGFVCVEALDELYYAESATYLYGVIVKGIPAGVLFEGARMDISYGNYSGTVNF